MQRSSVEFDIEQAKELLKEIIGANRANLANGIKDKVVLSWSGDPGLGKTSAAKQVAGEMGMEFAQLNLAQIEELSDLVGYPYQAYNVIKDGESKFVDKIEHAHAIDNGWSPGPLDSKMCYSPPEWMANKQGKSILLLIDDWTRADKRTI